MGRLFQRRPADGTCDLEFYTWRCRFEAVDRLFDTDGIFVSEYTDIDQSSAHRCDYIRPQAAVDLPDIDGYAPRRVIEGKESLDQVGELQDGTGALVWIQTRMRSFPFGDDLESAHSLSLSFYLALRA